MNDQQAPRDCRHKLLPSHLLCGLVVAVLAVSACKTANHSAAKTAASSGEVTARWMPSDGTISTLVLADDVNHPRDKVLTYTVMTPDAAIDRSGPTERKVPAITVNMAWTVDTLDDAQSVKQVFSFDALGPANGQDAVIPFFSDQISTNRDGYSDAQLDAITKSGMLLARAADLLKTMPTELSSQDDWGALKAHVAKLQTLISKTVDGATAEATRRASRATAASDAGAGTGDSADSSSSSDDGSGKSGGSSNGGDKGRSGGR